MSENTQRPAVRIVNQTPTPTWWKPWTWFRAKEQDVEEYQLVDIVYCEAEFGTFNGEIPMALVEETEETG